MMHLTDLPEDILILIIQQLDTKSILNLYYTCKRLKIMVCMTGVVKECHLSMNTLATVNSLNTNFFKAIAPHLVELNLSGVPDLRKSYLMPTMKRMKNLQTLDVSFTNINLLDFLDIYEHCPTIKNVSLNFMVSPKSDLSSLAHDIIIHFQEVFANFRCVHFVGSAMNLLHSKLPFLLLQESSLDCLKYTIAVSDQLINMNIPAQAQIGGQVRYKRFFVCFLDWDTVFALFKSVFMFCGVSICDLSSIESIIIIKKNFKKYSIYTTPIFQNYFQENFDVPPEKVFQIEHDTISVTGNAAIMIWNKEAHDFNDKFFRELHKILKPFFPCDCGLFSKQSVPEKYDWFYVTPEAADTGKKLHPFYEFRRRRVNPPINGLNYDELFKTKKRVQLTLTTEKFLKNPITLPTKCNYLEKLTFLRVTDVNLISEDFFKILFKNCVNLVTVSIDSPSMQSCVLPMSRAIHLSPGLKNLRLIDHGIDYKLLFPSLAKCKTLENVHIEDISTTDILDIGNPAIIIDQCPNLYSLYILAPLSEKTRLQKTRILHRVKISRNKHHINIVIHAVKTAINKFYCYDPFLSVFNLYTIKHIEAF